MDALSNARYKPPIPFGFHYIWGNCELGYMIERDVDGSQFFWVPANSLEKNGTIDGTRFNHSFGRRSFDDTPISNLMESASLSFEQATRMRNSVERYGGFYISRFLISKASVASYRSVPGSYPVTNVSFYDAYVISQEFVDFYNHHLSSHLVFPSEYDSMVQWQIKLVSEHKCIKNVLALDSGFTEWTQEQSICNPNLAVVREHAGISSRRLIRKTHRSKLLGFRVALSIDV
ncbi:MAG: hypothetical protein IKP28_03655 [Clostridia bacterium]|nr:hypothetical protein [Clostridia bacterium]